MLNNTCSIISRAAGTALDIYGEALTTTTGTVTVACEIQQIRKPSGMGEPGEGGEFAVSEWVGFFPSGTTFDTGDRVSEASLGTFEVVGRPWDANTGSAAVNHVEATLKETKGSA